MKQPSIKEDEKLFLAKRLLQAGVDNGEKFNELLLNISGAGNYIVLPWKEDMFFTEVATKMRDLWPTGMKEGKWPWRDSVSNLAERIKVVWEIKGFGDKYTVDDCLFVARRYLAQFTDDRRYMKLLKYFIGKKQEIFVGNDGRIKNEVQSDFANMLEAMTDEDALEQSAEESWNIEGYGGTII